MTTIERILMGGMVGENGTKCQFGGCEKRAIAYVIDRDYKHPEPMPVCAHCLETATCFTPNHDEYNGDLETLQTADDYPYPTEWRARQ